MQYAVFGLLPSNSRLCEQVHGMLCQSLSSGIGMDQSDAQFSYKVNTEYMFRQERRELVNTSNNKEGNDNAQQIIMLKAVLWQLPSHLHLYLWIMTIIVS